MAKGGLLLSRQSEAEKPSVGGFIVVLQSCGFHVDLVEAQGNCIGFQAFIAAISEQPLSDPLTV